MAFSERTLSFLLENRLMDSREWFHAHKAEYQAEVVAPMAELFMQVAPAMAEVDPEFIRIPQVGKSISRLWRDTRFQEGSVFRESIWFSFVREKYRGYPSYWFAVSPQGCSWGLGWYDAGSATMKRLRERVLAQEPAWLAADAALLGQSALTEQGKRYKRSPFTQAPPQQRRWLEQRNISLEAPLNRDILFAPELAQVLIRDFTALAPVYTFLRDSTVPWSY